MIDPTTGVEVPDTGQGMGTMTLPADPTQMQGQITDQQRQMQALQQSSLARRSMQAQQGFQGQDPRVAQAQAQQAQLKQILGQVQQDAPENEDPLDLQARLSARIMSTMGQTNPQLALQASQRLIQIQQAKSQRDLLGVKMQEGQATTAQTQTTTATDQWKLANDQAIPKMMYMIDSSKPEQAPLASIQVTNPDGTTRDPQAISSELAQAQKANPTGVLVGGDQLMNSKTAVAAYRANATIQAAQMRMLAVMNHAQEIPAAQRTAFGTASMNTLALGNQVDQISNFIDQHPGANTWMQGAAGFMAKMGAQASAQVAERGTTADQQASQQAIGQIDVPTAWGTQSGVYKSMVTNLAWTLAQSSLRGRLTNTELHQAAEIIGDSPNPAQMQENMANVMNTKVQSYDTYLSAQGLSGQNAALDQAHEQNSAQLHAIMGRLQDRVTRAAGGKTPGTSAAPAPTGTVDNERAQANAAIAAGRDANQVKLRFKQRTGQDL